MTPFAFGFVGFDPGEMRGMVGDAHRPAAAWIGAGQMLVLQGLNKSPVHFALLL
jgi:hypothetical protein